MSLFKERADALRTQIHSQGIVVVTTPAQMEAFCTLKKQYVQQICDEIRDSMMKQIESNNLRHDTKTPQGFFSVFGDKTTIYNYHYLCGWGCIIRLDLSQSIFEYKKVDYCEPYSDTPRPTNAFITNDISLVMECLQEVQSTLREDEIYPVERTLINGTWKYGNYKMVPTSIVDMDAFQKLRTMIEAYKKDRSKPLYDVSHGKSFAYFVKKK